MHKAQPLGHEPHARERLEQHPQPLGPEHESSFAARVQHKRGRNRNIFHRAGDILPRGALFGRGGVFARIAAEIGRVADYVIHAAVRQQRANFAQVALQGGDVHTVVRNRLAEQVERALLQLKPGDGQVRPVDQQRERARAAAQIEHAGVPARPGKGGEQHAVLPELEKAVVLPQGQPIRQVFDGLRHVFFLRNKERPARSGRPFG